METPAAVGPRQLLRRLRDMMAAKASAQERLNEVVRIIAADMVAEVCSVYIRRAGDVLDLSMISQTNVLGDSDQVALVRGRFDAATGGPTVTISTGSNALINKASILDVDSAGGKIMLGGDHYSDEILFQAELVAPGHALDPGANPDALAYEAIAFLDHPGAASLDTETVGGKPSDALANHHTDISSHDVMHTMLS